MIYIKQRKVCMIYLDNILNNMLSTREHICNFFVLLTQDKVSQCRLGNNDIINLSY